MAKKLLLGDEAIAQGAIDAGLSGVYAYPGTPSTEITEYIQGYCSRNPDEKIHNRLGEPTVMTVLTDDFCHIDMDERSTIEMKILNDSTFCIVNSVKVTTHWDSDIRVYKSDWTELSSTDFFAMPTVEQFIPKPESMTPTQYRNLLNRAETPFYHMSFTAGSTDLTVTYSTSATTDSDYDTMLRPYIHPTLTLSLRQ